MSVLIHGLEMPQEGFVEILIGDDGTVLQTGQSYRIDGTDYYTPYVGEMPVMYKAIPIPPHGRLIDADAINHEDEIWKKKCIPQQVVYNAWVVAGEMPTVIPADKGGET